jgi:sugar lactone lactonase YvrE
VTACTFGGADRSTLFITTSKLDLPESEAARAGSIYQLDDTGAVGVASQAVAF